MTALSARAAPRLLLAALSLCLAGACGGASSVSDSPGVPAPQVVRPAPAAAETEHDAEGDARHALLGLAAADPVDRPRLQHELLSYIDRALGAFVEVLGESGNGIAARQAAAWVLGEADDPRACVALGEAWLATVGQDERLRVAIAVAAGRCGQFVPLEALAEHASQSDVRLKAAMALGLMGRREAGLSISLLSGEVDPTLRDYATLSLALLGDSVAASDIVASLAGTLPGPPDIAAFFALALWRAGEESIDVWPTLRQAAVQHPDPVVREAALQALHAARDDYATTMLTTALSDPSPRVAHRAEAWLGEH